MRKIITLLAVLALTVFGVVAAQTGEKEAQETTPWFDMENCGMCKSLMSEEGLMDHMKWENHNIPTGMMSISIVDKAYEEKFEKVAKMMEETGAKLMAGEQIPLCGMCQSFGAILMSGKAQYQTIKSEAAHIEVLTSTDPEVIDMIHKHTDRTNAEYAKMLEAEKQAE